MAHFPSFCGIFWALVEKAIAARIAEILPLPKKTLTTDLSSVHITQLSSNPEFPPMATQSLAATLRNDVPFGYEASPVTTLNGNGVQDTDTPTLTTSDATIGTITFIAPTRYWIQLPDAAPTGSVVTLSGDFDPTQTADNFEFVITIGVDNITSDVGGVTFAPLAAAPV